MAVFVGFVGQGTRRRAREAHQSAKKVKGLQRIALGLIECATCTPEPRLSQVLNISCQVNGVRFGLLSMHKSFIHAEKAINSTLPTVFTFAFMYFIHKSYTASISIWTAALHRLLPPFNIPDGFC